MSISQRKFRALVGQYADAGTQGAVDSTFVPRSSGDPDHMWWCSKVETSGSERTVGMQADHRVSAVFTFAAECPVSFDDAILCDGRSYKVTSALPRQYGHDEIEVDAERQADMTLTQS